MALDAETMRLINAARMVKLSPEARSRVKSVTPVTTDLVVKVKSAKVKASVKPTWEFVPSYKLPIAKLGPVPGTWCKVTRPRVNKGLEKRRVNQAKHQTATYRAGTSVFYGAA